MTPRTTNQDTDSQDGKVQCPNSDPHQAFVTELAALCERDRFLLTGRGQKVGMPVLRLSAVKRIEQMMRDHGVRKEQNDSP